MRLPLLAGLVALSLAGWANAEPVPIAVNGDWTTLQDAVGETKMCGVQAAVNGGKFTVFGSSDRPGILRIGLRKAAWHITDVAVPLVVRFGGNVTFNFNGFGSGSTIRIDIPAAEVRSFIHHLTADKEAIIALPEGHEPLWKFDLTGTTPATLALGQCIDATQINLPAPFRAPNPVVSQIMPNSAVPDNVVSPAEDIPAVTSRSGSAETPPFMLESTAPDAATKPQTQELEATPEQSSPPYAHSGAQSDPPQLPVNERSIGSGTGTLFGLGIVLLIAITTGGIALYFVPFMIGSSRKIENLVLLFVTNFFFGWTIFGWFGCLLWAALAQDAVQRSVYRKMLEDHRA